ncbi:MAG TPA: DUF167 domain-containing protein [Vicinamibacterales bacterium]|nr:DUF167 domain-containing protein [Vicinamibacterales bacterium]
MAPLALSSAPGGVRIQVRVIPRSPRTAIDGVREGRLLLRVTAPPVDDSANHAVVELLARALALPRRAVRIVSGETARNKTLEIAGLDAADVRSRLGFGT